MLDVRLRTQLAPIAVEERLGKITTDSDVGLLITGAARLRKPDGSLLCVYLPRRLAHVLDRHPEIYDVLHSMRTMLTDNRGAASGSERVRYGEGKRTRSKRVASAMLGAFSPQGSKPFCRYASWNSKHPDEWRLLWPLFQEIAEQFSQHAPDRYAAQMRYVNNAHPDWVIPGTPFSTITVNNTYPTGVHYDSGDCEEGFSTLAVLRRGYYDGGLLVIPRYQVGIDMQDGDLLLLDAHEAHGNTAITRTSPMAERISLVSYFRTGVLECGSFDEELRKAQRVADQHGGVR